MPLEGAVLGGSVWGREGEGKVIQTCGWKE